MRGFINDCLRSIIGFTIRWFGLVLVIVQRIKIITFYYNQRHLRKAYGIASKTPILSYGYSLEQLIKIAAARAGKDAKFAFTSGSTASPKRILYTKNRLRVVQFTFIDVFARCCWSLNIKQTSLYVFSSFSKDSSLTSMLIEETRLPAYLSSLQASYRVQSHPAIQSIASIYGATAVRLWILAIANPGIIYSTNPSTISTFLDELSCEWQKSSKFIKDWYQHPEAFDHSIHMIARRLESRGSSSRLASIASSDLPLPLQICAPAVRHYICWEGGYVKPFLNRLANYLPPEHYRLIPMYSMSTETIETVTHCNDQSLSFLPLADQVLYEFIEEREEDHPDNLRTADQLQEGKTYALVISDSYGLRRYQTGDLFLCKGFVSGLPDLHFMRRRDLEYSFTGEKLTAEQVSMVFRTLREEYAWLGEDKFLTCVPSQPANETIPHYKLVLINEAASLKKGSGEELAIRCDELFSEVNCEYKSKRESGRLGQIRFIYRSPSDFINCISGSQQSSSWESQFKFLPLYQSRWESLLPSSTRINPSSP